MFYDEEGIFFLSHAYFMYKRLSHTSLASPPLCYYTLKNLHRISLIARAKTVLAMESFRNIPLAV